MENKENYLQIVPVTPDYQQLSVKSKHINVNSKKAIEICLTCLLTWGCDIKSELEMWGL